MIFGKLVCVVRLLAKFHANTKISLLGFLPPLLDQPIKLVFIAWAIVFSLNQILNFWSNKSKSRDLSLKFVVHLLNPFSIVVKDMSFLLNVPNRTSKLVLDFLLQPLEFHS